MKTATVIVFVLSFVVSLLTGGWALMLAVDLLGGSVSYLSAIAAFALIRSFIVTPWPPVQDR